MKVLMYSARHVICRSKGFMMIHDLGCLHVRYGISNDLKLLLLSSFYNFLYTFLEWHCHKPLIPDIYNKDDEQFLDPAAFKRLVKHQVTHPESKKASAC